MDGGRITKYWLYFSDTNEKKGNCRCSEKAHGVIKVL